MNVRKYLIAVSTLITFIGVFLENFWITLSFITLFLAMIIEGAIKTFKRNAVVAALFLIFLLPVYVFWAFAEFFTSDNLEKKIED